MSATGQAAIRVVAALIFRDQRLLVCQRNAVGAFPLKWEFPGGKVEAGESDVDALRRELHEELAIAVGGARLFSEYDYSYLQGPTVSLAFYETKDFEGEPQNLIFHRMEWAKVAELERFDFLDGDRPIIERLMAVFGERPARIGTPRGGR